MKSYRLPDGDGYTTDVDEYLDAWVALADVALEFFPGYYLHSYNPIISLANDHPYAPLLNLTVSEVKALRDYRDRKQAEIAALQEEVDLLRAEVRKQAFGSKVVFDREVVERAHAEKS